MDTKLITSFLVMAFAITTSFAEDAAKSPDAKADAKFTLVLTRQLQGEGRLEWITSMRKKLPMAQREVGPFGLSQDPNQKVAVKKGKSVSSKAFLNAIKVMQINFVNAVDGRFAVGSREFREGQTFPLVRGSQSFTTQIVKVRRSYIIFKDVNNGEHIKKNLDVLPEGMTKDGKLEAIEGIEPRSSGKNQPLKL